MNKNKEILIVGAGPSGLSTAMFLNELGYFPKIIDKKTRISDYSKALEVLTEVEEVEKTIFGDDSLQIAKTLKVIGTIQIIINRP